MKTWLTTAPKILCNWNMIWYQWHLSWSYFKILIKLALPSSTLIEHQISFHSFSQQSLRIRFTPKRFKITPRLDKTVQNSFLNLFFQKKKTINQYPSTSRLLSFYFEEKSQNDIFPSRKIYCEINLRCNKENGGITWI